MFNALATCPCSGAQPEEVSNAFTALLDQHVETVNNFYMERIEEGVIVLHALQQHAEQIRSGQAKPELRTACQRSLVSFHFQLLVLQNYVALNFTALTKILKKFEKKFEICIKDEYISAIVELPFYRCDSLGECVDECERQFRALEGLRPQPALAPPLPGGLQPQSQPPQPLAGAGGAPTPHSLMPPPPPKLPQAGGAPPGMVAGMAASESSATAGLTTAPSTSHIGGKASIS